MGVEIPQREGTIFVFDRPLQKHWQSLLLYSRRRASYINQLLTYLLIYFLLYLLP